MAAEVGGRATRSSAANMGAAPRAGARPHATATLAMKTRAGPLLARVSAQLPLCCNPSQTDQTDVRPCGVVVQACGARCLRWHTATYRVGAVATLGLT
jgi:hypothetical protein